MADDGLLYEGLRRLIEVAVEVDVWANRSSGGGGERVVDEVLGRGVRSRGWEKTFYDIIVRSAR